jgi:hypothetical protein
MEYSRESSVEHDRPVSQLDRPGSQIERPSSQMDRPGSQMSGAGKRKSSPKFHFLKNNRRKTPQPNRVTTPEVGSAGNGQIVQVETSGTHGIVQVETSASVPEPGSHLAGPQPGSHLSGQPFINDQVINISLLYFPPHTRKFFYVSHKLRDFGLSTECGKKIL